jgi:diguanylate cyclase (GGDEF)-like protein
MLPTMKDSISRIYGCPPFSAIRVLEWLGRPIDPTHEGIRSELAQTLSHRLEMVVFGGVCVGVTCVAYGLLYDILIGSALLALALAIVTARLVSLRRVAAHSGQFADSVVWSGLLWAAMVGVVGGACALTAQIALTTLAALVITGLAFGCAFANAGAPRFTKAQVTLIVVPFAVAAAFSGAPHMLLVTLQAPLWLGGIYLIIAQTHQTRARLIISELRNRYLAFNDDLTGLANRAKIMATLDAATQDSGYVLYLDLDGFKGINDQFGHRIGDELLCAVAARFRATLRPGDFIGRMGGDEFIVILDNLSSTQVKVVAERLIKTAAEPFNLEGAPNVCIGVSVGGAPLAPSEGVRRVIETADRMLYAAKRAGKGTLRLSGGQLKRRSKRPIAESA